MKYKIANKNNWYFISKNGDSYVFDSFSKGAEVFESYQLPAVLDSILCRKDKWGNRVNDKICPNDIAIIKCFHDLEPFVEEESTISDCLYQIDLIRLKESYVRCVVGKDLEKWGVLK